MPQQGISERVAQSRVTGFFMRRPRLTAFLLVMVLFVAVQGGAVAGDSIDVGSDGSTTTTDTGPDSDE